MKPVKNAGKSAEVAVIGSGFSGMAAAAVLARNGKNVTVFEKHQQVGGRARTFSQAGFVFDMGPSWYWMPDVYERFYEQFGTSASDFYELKRLDPGFAVIFGVADILDIPADFDQICDLFESIEPGSARKLQKFIAEGAFKYEAGMRDMVYKPGNSFTEFLDFGLFRNALKMQLFTSISKHARSYFKDPRLLALIEFPVLFLGAMPQETPALYSLMNFSAFKQGTYYPMGGFGKVAESFRTIAENQGVNFSVSQNVEKLETEGKFITHLHANGNRFSTNAVIGSADYHHIETNLLDPENRSYTEAYWDSRVFAPSALLFYLGVKKKINRLRHHNLFFDEDFEQHAADIYKNKRWPARPLFYVCCPSKTDPGVAPEGCENIFILMPVATGLKDPRPMRENYYNILMDRLEQFAGENIRNHVVFKKSYSVSDFTNDYNAYKGNAYGLANTLMQTAIFKPKLKSRKVKNLFYAGQLTVPGPGVPPSIISGQIAAHELLKFLNK